jgi:hypothetical protein
MAEYVRESAQRPTYNFLKFFNMRDSAVRTRPPSEVLRSGGSTEKGEELKIGACDLMLGQV